MGRARRGDGDRMRAVAVNWRLETIAGPPLAMLTVPNTASSPLDIGPTEARILYVVALVTAQSNVKQIANIGGNSNDFASAMGAQVIRGSEIGKGGLVHRAQAIGGVDISQSMLAGWPWNAPLAGCGWWDGSRFGSQGYREAPTIGAPYAGGSINTTPRLRMASIVSDGTTPIAALAYRGIHDLATRTRILSWLMQRYG